MLVFLIKKKRIINIVFVISVLLDIGISFIVNLLSQTDFDIFATHNIVLLSVLLVVVALYIICQLVMRNFGSKKQNRRLQKAFQDNGGYELVVDEMKSCIEKHDYKSIKELKKIVNYIEK